MEAGNGFEVVRDPVWDNIRVEPAAMQAVDTDAFQRLRYVRQLGHAFLVYPGATHTRFEHALGAYHLARRALATLQERGDLAGQSEADCLAIRLAALLHDIGHYPFSHALEEAGFPGHEALGAKRLNEGSLGALLRSLGGDGLVERIAALIQGTSASPLAGLVSGSLDLDKLDYLSRDARMCGVPYGVVDVDRLLASLALVTLPGGAGAIGVQEKGVSALESLLFSKYQMYRNVYWHHAVRAATCMFKRAVRATLAAGNLTPREIEDATDGSMEALLLTRDPTGLAVALRERRLYKRAFDSPASDIVELPAWLSTDPERVDRAETRLARHLGLPPAGVLIDCPARPSMLQVNLPLLTHDNQVEQLTDEGRAGTFGLPRVAEELYNSARRVRVFTVEFRSLSTLPEEIFS